MCTASTLCALVGCGVHDVQKAAASSSSEASKLQQHQSGEEGEGKHKKATKRHKA